MKRGGEEVRVVVVVSGRVRRVSPSARVDFGSGIAWRGGANYDREGERGDLAMW